MFYSFKNYSEESQTLPLPKVAGVRGAGSVSWRIHYKKGLTFSVEQWTEISKKSLKHSLFNLGRDDKDWE